MTEWTAPPPAEDPRRMRGGRVWLGIAIALSGHAVSIGLGLMVGALDEQNQIMTAFGIMIIAQFFVFAACLAAGIVLLNRGDRGIGAGILIGWAIGLLVAPVVGFGICVNALNGGVGG
jgi:hypothetical protein